MRGLRRPHVAMMAAGSLSLVLVGCGGYAPTAVPSPAPSASDQAAAPAATCDNTYPANTASYAPQGAMPKPGQMPAGSTMERILQRGKLIAGVSADQNLLGFFDPEDGHIKGFDIDMAHEVAAAIFGTAKGHLQLKVITSAERIPELMKGDVDIVARNMTINCSRWKDIAFSAEYYHSGQKILVQKGEEGSVHSFADLDGKRVCAPAGTTSLDQLREGAPQAVPVVTDDDAACLVALQNGQADAVTTDDTVLAGLAAQDPYAAVADTDALSSEPYGIGVNKDDRDLVEFVNGVLVQMHDDGAWQRSYRHWFEPYLGSGSQPTPVYGR